MKKRAGTGIDPARRAAILGDWPEEGSVPSAPPETDPEPADTARARELAAALDVIASRAEGLRRAGVRRVQVGEVTAELDPFVDVAKRGSDRPPPPADPLDDPSSYPNGEVPRLRSVKEMFHGDED